MYTNFISSLLKQSIFSVSAVYFFTENASIFSALKKHAASLGHPQPWQINFQTPAAPIAEGIIAFHDDLMVFLVSRLRLCSTNLNYMKFFKLGAAVGLMPLESKPTHTGILDLSNLSTWGQGAFIFLAVVGTVALIGYGGYLTFQYFKPSGTPFNPGENPSPNLPQNNPWNVPLDPAGIPGIDRTIEKLVEPLRRGVDAATQTLNESTTQTLVDHVAGIINTVGQNPAATVLGVTIATAAAVTPTLIDACTAVGGTGSTLTSSILESIIASASNIGGAASSSGGAASSTVGGSGASSAASIVSSIVEGAPNIGGAASSAVAQATLHLSQLREAGEPLFDRINLSFINRDPVGRMEAFNTVMEQFTNAINNPSTVHISDHPDAVRARAATETYLLENAPSLVTQNFGIPKNVILEIFSDYLDNLKHVKYKVRDGRLVSALEYKELIQVEISNQKILKQIIKLHLEHLHKDGSGRILNMKHIQNFCYQFELKIAKVLIVTFDFPVTGPTAESVPFMFNEIAQRYDVKDVNTLPENFRNPDLIRNILENVNPDFRDNNNYNIKAATMLFNEYCINFIKGLEQGSYKP